MVVRQKTFTLEEAAYLRSLPAVKEVSASRITYANWFKVECVRRYLKGEPARRIFREAGLEPSLIGSKRIERCVSRWKSDGSIMGEAAKEKTEDLDDEKSNIDAVGGGFQSQDHAGKLQHRQCGVHGYWGQ
ncbi:MAG: HTH domain-containing protein [Bifidobacterium catenulatum]